MTNRSDAFANAVSRKSSKFLSIGSFLYCRNPVLMLRGFAFDMPPGACYIWKYYLPLFSDIEFLNMSLGYRIPNGYIETRGKTDKEISDHALSIINKNDEFPNDESLEEIVSFSKNDLISTVKRSKLFRDIQCFEHESLEEIVERSARNRRKIGITG